MNENFSDIIRIFPIYQPLLRYTLPMQVRVTSITPSGMGIDNFSQFLASHVYFTVAQDDIEAPASATYYTLRDTPSLRLLPSKDINGLIYKATLSADFENLSAEGRAYLNSMARLSNYDVIVQRANGEYHLLRALASTAAFSIEENTQKNSVVKTKFELKVLALTPIHI